SIARELDAVVSRREELLKESRAAISLASRSIVKIHTEKMKDAEKDLAQLKNLLKELRKTADEDLKRYLIPPETEYVEAAVIKSVATRKTIPRHESLKVSSEAYLLGLLDSIGELKRMVYDSIRKGDVNRASDLFNLMETLYIQLSPYAIYDNVVQGVRRKLDISRRLIEDTRAAVTEEVRRAEFMKSMNSLANRLPQKRRPPG
ncbi:MAG: RNA-binding protein, partial [Nitrososphaerales archaeon]